MKTDFRPLILFAAFALVCGTAQASEETPTTDADPTPAFSRFAEGVHYHQLAVPVETRDPSKIEVVEVFSYNCPHCYHLEALLTGWLAVQPDDVDFYRLPLATRNLQTLAQGFYTAQAMDVLPQVHLRIFESIHEYGIDMSRPQYLRRLFQDAADVDEEEFMRTFESFGVQTRVRQADNRSRMYRIKGTPAMIVNGRYLSEAAVAGSVEGMLLVVNELIAKEREAMAAKSPEADD